LLLHRGLSNLTLSMLREKDVLAERTGARRFLPRPPTAVRLDL
jgi:hypothetical protein